MPSLRVLEPGLHTTVQDLGRRGYGAIGVPPSGAADSLSLIIGNRLLGNEDGAAALECTVLGPRVVVEMDTWVCLCGAGCPAARIDGGDGERSLPMGDPVWVRSGEAIHVGGTSDGCRAYLCVAGGVAVAPVLGSRSTFVGGRFGGHAGRVLRSGDAVPMRVGAGGCRAGFRDLSEWHRSRRDRRVLRAVTSLHADRFPAGALEMFASTAFVVQPRSDRVGIRLDGSRVPVPGGVGSFESEPTVVGGVQITADGLPIVLGPDRPTTGGYPLLACVIEADLPATAQLCPGDSVRFELVSIDHGRGVGVGARRELDALLPPGRNGLGA